MKKHILLLSLVVISITMHGQTILNRNFETWNLGTYSYPLNYPYTSSNEKAYVFLENSASSNVVKTTSAYHGTYGVELSTKVVGTDTIGGYFLNFNPNNSGSLSTFHGGMPYAQKPTGIRGYYKYNMATADSALILVAFSKAGTNIGSYYAKIGGVHTSFTLFNLTFSPALTETPDSVIFGAASSWSVINDGSGIPGSTLVIDSVSFTGVSVQPDLLNGDFESWQDTTFYTLDNWYSDENGKGVYRTTDAVAGDYAVELKTFLGKMNDHKAARPGVIRTGYYSDNCNGNCTELGGYPFTNTKDTLAFYYKYTPSGNDSAQVSLSFKSKGIIIGGSTKYLLASTAYQEVEIPFNLEQTPDSVIIDIQSSSYADTLVSFVGSDLIIDAIRFKSVSITKTDPVITWPTPADITYGTLLSAIQLNATADVAGTLVYTPAIGTKLEIGNSQTLTVDFTPTDVADYNSASKTVSINVLSSNNVSTINENKIELYPNPASSYITIESPVNISSVVVTSIDGKIVYEEKLVNSTKTSISLTSLNPGLYFVTIAGNFQSTVVKKLIVTGK
jgi:hypothetical protein